MRQVDIALCNLTMYLYIHCSVSFAVIRTLSVTIGNNRNLMLRRLTPQQTLEAITSVSVSNPAVSRTSSDNLLAYRSNYDDNHAGNNLGVVFLNLNGIFPCVPPGARIPCGVVAMEEDAFNSGQVFIQAIDGGNHFRIFSSSQNFYTYGIAVQGCSQLTTSCWPKHVEKGITCQLPRQYCG